MTIRILYCPIKLIKNAGFRIQILIYSVRKDIIFKATIFYNTTSSISTIMVQQSYRYKVPCQYC